MQKTKSNGSRSAAVTALVAACATGAAIAVAPTFRADAQKTSGDTTTTGTTPVVTGKAITPQGDQVTVGSLPMNMTLSPDGRFAVVCSMGDRAFLTALRTQDGQTVSQVGFNGPAPGGRGKAGLYYGIAFGPKSADGATPVYAARGADGLVSVLSLAADGTLTDTGRTIDAAGGVVAGLAADAAGSRLYAANNVGDPKKGLASILRVLSVADGKVTSEIPVPGYPYAVASLTKGPDADKKVYVGSEQRGVVSVIDPAAGRVAKDIRTGDHPLALLLNGTQDRLFVANAGSDTVSIVRTDTDKVEKTILLRPADARGLAGATPAGLALSPDEKTLYVTLADMYAVAVVDIGKGAVTGYIPVGWYPTGIAVSPDGARLFVANARGVVARTPNDKPVSYAAGEGSPKYIQNILEGTVSVIDLNAARASQEALTRQTLANNRIVPNLTRQAQSALKNPGIQHVIYIIKENRTYDQVLGDLPQGNGDPSLTLFGRDVTPNLHALAERFVLLDNFYCPAEVSGDGWQWSTAGMANPYDSRNVPYGYTGRRHPYDYEGTNNGVAPDLFGIPDVARPAGGYLWDDAVFRRISLRNYGFYTDDLHDPRETAEKGTEGLENAATKKALAGVTDRDFRQFDLEYADSDAWVKYGLSPAPRQRARYGSHNAPSRFSEWKREFDGYVQSGKLPQLMLIRMGNDHTAGTTPGGYSPRALVADNDYAIGQIVEAVSHSPYWKSTAIFIVEDDAQAGNDHVDAHRSTAYVISPYIAQGTHDSRFFNTESVLHTMENLLGLRQLTQFDAVAPTLNVFSAAATNDAPYSAILPDRAIVGEVNQQTAYRAEDSRRLYVATEADTGPDAEMNDILWHAVKGRNVPMPPARHAWFEKQGQRDRSF